MKIKVRMIAVTQLIDILVNIEAEGVQYVNLNCEISKESDKVFVERYSDTPAPAQKAPEPEPEELIIINHRALTQELMKKLLNN